MNHVLHYCVDEADDPTLFNRKGQVGEIHDLDCVETGRRGVFFVKGKPLTLENREL